MCDCLWFAIGACAGDCKCDQYLSMNSDLGANLTAAWGAKVDEVLASVAVEFTKEHGFKKER